MARFAFARDGLFCAPASSAESFGRLHAAAFSVVLFCGSI
jgi:hypothetical protein